MAKASAAMEEAKRISEELRSETEKLKAHAERLIKQATFLKECCADLEDRLSAEAPNTNSSVSCPDSPRRIDPHPKSA
jgi:vacuolar-type H+-ATPase subunit E/Vma4